MSEDYFDEEFQRIFSEVRRLREKVSGLETRVAEFEKRELLRVRGNQYCRVCQAHLGRPNPPISETEQKYHDANHATGTQADLSKGLSGYPATINWDDIERQIADFRRASGR
jgi:hypothetical protein